MKYIYVCIVTLFMLSGCGFLTTIKPSDQINDISASNSVLILEEDFVVPKGYTFSSSVFPKGIYIADTAATSGYINYVSSRKISLKFPWYYGLGGTFQCFAGFSVKMDNPYSDYKVFVYGCGDNIVVEDTSQTAKFRIESANRL